jgi:hypothetical protein
MASIQTSIYSIIIAEDWLYQVQVDGIQLDGAEIQKMRPGMY